MKTDSIRKRGKFKRTIKGMGWNNMDGKELKLEKIWDDMDFNGNREFDMARF